MTARVQLAHHWLVGMRGGEKVLEQLALLFPGAVCHTLVARPERLSAELRSLAIRTSFLQSLPGGVARYKSLLPLFPAAIRGLRVMEPIDLLISSDAALMKGLLVPDAVPHICYCHSPPRYIWDMHDTYLKQASNLGWLGRKVFSSVVPAIKEFDREGAQRVTAFIANSIFVQERIRRCYGRESHVINPPVSVDRFCVGVQPPEDFYLIVSQLVPYKRIDLAVAAFNKLGRKLVVIGEGSELESLRAMASDIITFLGSQPDEVLIDHYQRCRAFIFPGVEDFGITPLEAQASGRPVIAYRAGGALETIVEGETGLFFDEQDSESLAEAVERFEREKDRLTAELCRRQAERFSPERFRTEIKSFLEATCPGLFKDALWPDSVPNS